MKEPQHEALAAAIRAGGAITVLTGAGVSAASGVPTFRGQDGLWRSFPAEQLATAEAFDQDPALVWEWYAWRRALVAAAQPNAAHRVLADWSCRPDADVRIVTQNVDDLHVRAGTVRLVRLHGSLWELACRNRCATAPPTWPDLRVPLPVMPPRCPHCGGLARPAVVWFGESLPADALADAIDATRCRLFLAVGTSALVHPAAGLIGMAREHGAFTVEINPETTAASGGVDLALTGRAEVVLPQLDELAFGLPSD
ncbi:MAG: NAD-dependent deacylase [Acidobacteria bacterium]|nr:NAD-dependent deacylase [Acidobacteriota bacterium]